MLDPDYFQYANEVLNATNVVNNGEKPTESIVVSNSQRSIEVKPTFEAYAKLYNIPENCPLYWIEEEKWRFRNSEKMY
jgi:hypothetical protein